VDASRWEHGSDFHLTSEAGALEAPWLSRPHTLWGSGRDALRALLAWGRDQLGLQRVHAPTFFCPAVVGALAHELPVSLYDDAPDQPLPAALAASARDLALVVNTYGMRGHRPLETAAVVVEDHSHDPLSAWAFASDADYAVASLRKTLPLPDGGVLWSPRGHDLPPEREVTALHTRAAADRLAGQILKRAYLEGLSVEKDAFRARARSGEQAMGAGEISGMAASSRARLSTLPSGRWRARRAANLAAFRAALGKLPGARLLDAPFAATLLFDKPAVRDSVSQALRAHRVYPAVLWPLEGARIARRHRALSRRVLCLHCDFRYDEADMVRVAALLHAARDEAREAE
jgi:hypothetical protein